MAGVAVTSRDIASVGSHLGDEHSPGGARPVAGANPARCTERTLSGSKAAKSAQGTDGTFLGVQSRTPEDPPARGGGATDGPTAKRQRGSEKLWRLGKRGNP